MYFDEELTLTESECSVVEKEDCNLETVVRQVEQEVTDCGTVEEEICLNVMDTRLEEECKVVHDKVCQNEARDFSQVTEESDCKISTGSECEEGEGGEPAVLCETVMVSDCPQLDCEPGSTDPRCLRNIDEYGAPQAALLQDCVPRTKQICRKVESAVCRGAPGLSCTNSRDSVCVLGYHGTSYRESQQLFPSDQPHIFRFVIERQQRDSEHGCGRGRSGWWGVTGELMIVNLVSDE